MLSNDFDRKTESNHSASIEVIILTQYTHKKFCCSIRNCCAVDASSHTRSGQYIYIYIHIHTHLFKWCVHLGSHTNENISQDKILDYLIISHQVRTNNK